MRATVIALATALLGTALLPKPASAGFILKTLTQDASNACTLSIPTTDTGVRPKATGFRNEGGKSAFVICSVDVDTSGNDTTYIGLTLASFDGASHSVNCTAVARYSDTLANIQYYTIPTLSTAADGSFTNLSTAGAPPSVNAAPESSTRAGSMRMSPISAPWTKPLMMASGLRQAGLVATAPRPSRSCRTT